MEKATEKESNDSCEAVVNHDYCTAKEQYQWSIKC